ncbi:MAG: amidohydrolase family protein [Deltaproteobacteria bacterium]|nr:amidohydrolase family protein [Deltaproteobacteria bacterium]
MTLGFVLLGSPGCLIDRIGGAYTREPEELESNASIGAKRLIELAYEGIDPLRLVDYHTHIVGLGTDDSGAFVSPKTRNWLSLERWKYLVYASASGIKNAEQFDREYVTRLVRLARAIPRRGKYRILAFDKHYKPDGTVDLDKTNFYIPNEYIFRLTQQYPDIFLPVISVHPYRREALAELEKWSRLGAKFVKWLPNAMGIDPSSSLADPFYRKMKEHDMILLSHTGEEQAVEAAEDQRLGNPLLLRRALEHGVRVIMAHTASLGTCEDLDNASRKEHSCFDLALRLMGEPKYDGLLFAEISAMLQFNRMPEPFTSLLKRQDLHPRLVNGSDYPLPAINMLIHTGSMARAGFITDEERPKLNEIYDYNPLLFDFVLKRTMRHPETKQKLAPSVFMANPGLEN